MRLDADDDAEIGTDVEDAEVDTRAVLEEDDNDEEDVEEGRRFVEEMMMDEDS